MIRSMQYRLGVIGAGNMGRAIVEGAVRAGILPADAIIVAEPDEQRRAALEARGCSVEPRIDEVAEADAILLAVKPQVFPTLAPDIALQRPAVVISVMAGLGSAAIREQLGEHARVVRVMPNTPCQIGQGMSAIALGAGAGAEDDALAVAIFEAIGLVVRVAEDQIDAVTAVSGSGPAYVFLLAESMAKAALDLGLDAEVANTLVRQTILGAGHLLAASQETPAALRAAVTSPGGTTAAAVDVLVAGNLPETVARALHAARDRGRELNG